MSCEWSHKNLRRAAGSLLLRERLLLWQISSLVRCGSRSYLHETANALGQEEDRDRIVQGHINFETSCVSHRLATRKSDSGLVSRFFMQSITRLLFFLTAGVAANGLEMTVLKGLKMKVLNSGAANINCPGVFKRIHLRGIHLRGMKQAGIDNESEPGQLDRFERNKQTKDESEREIVDALTVAENDNVVSTSLHREGGAPKALLSHYHPRPQYDADENAEYVIDSFLRGDFYESPAIANAAAPLPSMMPVDTVKAALTSLRWVDGGAAIFLRFCAPLRRNERWGMSSSTSEWIEIMRGSLTPTMLFRRIQASANFRCLLEWSQLELRDEDCDDGEYYSRFVVSSESLRKNSSRNQDAPFATNTFVKARMTMAESKRSSFMQFRLVQINGVWLIDSMKLCGGKRAQSSENTWDVIAGNFTWDDVSH